MLRLPVAGAGHPSPVPLALTLAGRVAGESRYRVTCGVCGSSTAPMDWPSVCRAGLAHRSAHARVMAGEPLEALTRRAPAPALEAASA
jgi:hypothetical protein